MLDYDEGAQGRRQARGILAFLEAEGDLAVLGGVDESVFGGEGDARDDAALGEGPESRCYPRRSQGPIQGSDGPAGEGERRGRRLQR